MQEQELLKKYGSLGVKEICELCVKEEITTYDAEILLEQFSKDGLIWWILQTNKQNHSTPNSKL